MQSNLMINLLNLSLPHQTMIGGNELWHTIIPIFKLFFIIIIIIFPSTFIMPRKSFKCSLDILSICVLYRCSSSYNLVRMGKEIHPSLSLDEDYTICYNLECILCRNNNDKPSTNPILPNDFELPTKK